MNPPGDNVSQYPQVSLEQHEIPSYQEVPPSG